MAGEGEGRGGDGQRPGGSRGGAGRRIARARTGGEAGGGGRAGRARSRESRARARRLAARRGRSIAAASRVSFPGGRSWRRWGKLRGTRGLAVAPDPLARSLPPLGPPPRPPAPASFGAFFSTVVHPSSTMARRADGRSNDSPAGARRGGLFVLLARAPTRTREGRGLAGARARAGRGVYALPNARGGDDQPRSTEHGSGERRALENESRRSIAEEKKEVERRFRHVRRLRPTVSEICCFPVGGSVSEAASLPSGECVEPRARGRARGRGRTRRDAHHPEAGDRDGPGLVRESRAEVRPSSTARPRAPFALVPPPRPRSSWSPSNAFFS